MPVQVAERLVEDSYASITISEADFRRLAAEVDAAFDERGAGRDQEFADLTANRARLEAERDKLLAAHVADAVDLPTLKRHQDRVRAGLADTSFARQPEASEPNGNTPHLPMSRVPVRRLWWAFPDDSQTHVLR
ncbi:hypothetical protein [Pseudactinotalea sp. HY160]|uniref:hypothetical protein n=1 Tax=Pseudactinotalea sp. HY160 TaxID=2654490 RepID=UPI001D13F428|nr:hypothetical protein [Pseudactinotalea sp. HY160]